MFTQDAIVACRLRSPVVDTIVWTRLLFGLYGLDACHLESRIQISNERESWKRIVYKQAYITRRVHH